MKRFIKRICNIRCLIIEPKKADGKNMQIIILCHGYGAKGDDLLSIGNFLCESNKLIAEKVCFVFPEGPFSLENVGMPGSRAWWHLDFEALKGVRSGNDPRDLSNQIPDDMPKISVILMHTVEKLMSEYNVKAENIILGGFSQGSMITTDVALKMEQAPGSLVILSGTLVSKEIWSKLAKKRGSMKIFQSHGKLDPILTFNSAKKLRKIFLKSKLDHKFIPFDGTHEIPKKVILSLGELIEQKIKSSKVIYL